MGLVNAPRLLRRASRFFLCSISASKSWISTKSEFLRDQNILLMGPPGAGKTTVGKIVARRLGMPVIDVDDDILETAWKMPVAAKLAAIGGNTFLEEEGEALCNFSASGCVVSLTGSNPLHTEAMQHVKKHGLVVYLDVAIEDILQRLSGMKVNRIVGQEAGVSMREILLYRKQFYEKWLDVRVFCGIGDAIEEVVEKVLKALERYQNPDEDSYQSTRCDVTSLSDQKYFSDVIIEGLAADGGLYVPKNGFPKLSPQEWLRLVSMSYQERALVLLEKCIHPLDVSPSDLRKMIFKAYGSNFSNEKVAPVHHLIHNQYIQELFHGPTASFKDLALQLMPQLFASCLPPMCNYLILVATSGDTGSAVLSGFSMLSSTDTHRTGVLVFFPEEGVSEVQKLQMIGYRDGNARALSVLSDFDFCQKTIKKMFGESGLTGHLAVEFGTVLSTANSINWGRLLPQVVYHSSSYLDLCRDGVITFGDHLDVCIPTGNFGNAISAIYAKQMGIPIRKMICASNQNRIIADFICTGQYDLRDRPLMPSHSPAIDILKSSNLERLLHHVSDGNGRLIKDLFTHLDTHKHFGCPEMLLSRIQQDLQAGWCSDEDCLAAICSVHRQTGYIMDTHTAVAKVVADRLQEGSCPVVLSSTAHYSKFSPAVCKALHIPDIPQDPAEQLEKLEKISSRPGVHREVVKCLTQENRMEHRVCTAEYSVMVEEVENMIQDSFLKVC